MIKYFHKLYKRNKDYILCIYCIICRYSDRMVCLYNLVHNINLPRVVRWEEKKNGSMVLEYYSCLDITDPYKYHEAS